MDQKESMKKGERQSGRWSTRFGMQCSLQIKGPQNDPQEAVIFTFCLCDWAIKVHFFTLSAKYTAWGSGFTDEESGLVSIPGLQQRPQETPSGLALTRTFRQSPWLRPATQRPISRTVRPCRGHSPVVLVLSGPWVPPDSMFGCWRCGAPTWASIPISRNAVKCSRFAFWWMDKCKVSVLCGGSKFEFWVAYKWIAWNGVNGAGFRKPFVLTLF